MKKLIVLVISIAMLSFVYAADVNLTITIRDVGTNVSRILTMLNAKYPKINGETTKKQAERAVREMIRHELREYEREIAVQVARESVIVSTDIAE
jgi:hypothetical protein